MRLWYNNLIRRFLAAQPPKKTIAHGTGRFVKALMGNYTVNDIKEKLQPIFETIPVEKAILFGSYAKGTHTQKSDVDIVIDSKGKIQGIDFYGILEDIKETLEIPVDLLEASQIINGSRVQREIAETGVIIYERA